MISFLNNCQDHIGGGFGGGPGQLAHCAPTYAAVSALLICGSQEAYEIINREKIYSFLMRMKQADGSFRMHENGEIDVRYKWRD
jgi:protein farnesyltransferase subunit beta